MVFKKKFQMVSKHMLRPQCRTHSNILTLLIILVILPQAFFTSLKPKRETKSILLDQSICPLGWQSAGDICVRLFFNPATFEEAKQECILHGAEIVNIIKNEQDNKALMNDLTDLINEPLAAGITELTWLVGGMDTVLENPQLSYNLWVSTKVEDERDKSLALQRKVDKHFELITVAATSSYPFICSILALTRKTLLYEQALFPRGMPQIVEEPKLAYHYASRPDSYFVTVPCKAIGNPVPQIKWFKSGVEEIDLDASNTSYIVSGGSLLIPINKESHESTTYHCSATNVYGTVRSPSTIVRSAFIEPFRKSRLDVYPLNTKGTGTRIDCQTPQHYPKSYSFTWMFGGHSEQFVAQSDRIFISMDGTLYFSYNKKEDATSYACSLSLPSIQSGHYGPFFNLILPQSVPGTSSSPKIDEFQPQIFPEIPTRGQAVFIECFAYGFPAPKYKWSRVDGEPLSSRHRILNQGRVLKIDSVTVDDAARYKCVAFNEFGRESAEIQLLVHSPPTLLKPLINQRIATNASASFECIASSQYSNQVTIEWFHDGHPIAPLLMPAAERKRFKINENILDILNAIENDSGIYQCIISNDVGTVSSSARLTVEDAAPKFHGNIFPRRIFVVEGSKLSLPCLYLATPRGFAHWYTASSSDAISIDSKSRMRQRKELIGNEESIAVLEIDNIEKSDEGIFHCETSNGVGEGKGTVQVRVVPKPHIVVRPPSLASGMASNSVYQTPTKITCEVELACELPEDCPEALFDWQFNDKELRHVVARGLPLKMNAKEKTMENYWIESEDEIRSSRWLFETPSNKKIKESKKKKVKQVRQLSQVEVSPEFSSANIGRFSCTSIYGSGSSEITEPKALSAAPTQLKIIEINRNYAKLSWKQPANQKRRGFGTNVRMEGYQIEHRTGSNRQWRPFPGGMFKTEDRIIGSYLLKNLDSNEKFQFRVRTRAADGSMSAPSLHTEWIETPQSPPLDPIQRLQWRTIDDSHLLLEWDPIESGHQSGPNLRYNVSWSDPAPSIPALAKMPTDTFVHSEMVSEPNIVIPIKAYTPKRRKIKKNKNRVEDVTESCFTIAVGVQPLNDVGAGPTSTDTVVQISTEGPKRYADNLLAIPVNSTHLNLTWEWKNAGGCENIIGAYIQCLETSAFINDVSSFAINHSVDDEMITVKKMPPLTRETDSMMVNQSVPAHYTSWLVHDLSPGTEYSCTVRAFDQYGRYGNTSKHATTARTLDPAPPFPPEITMIKLQEMDDTLTTLMEWTAIPLRNSLYDNVTDHQRGYKILIYVSETAERPIVLTLTEAELQNPRRPSARIDGLKLMYYYTIKVAGFNEGGVGPVSKPTSIRLGVSGDFNGAMKSFSFFNVITFIIFVCLMQYM